MDCTSHAIFNFNVIYNIAYRQNDTFRKDTHTSLVSNLNWASHDTSVSFSVCVLMN